VNARGGQAFAILNGADDVQEKRRAERRSEARDISAENRKLVAQAAQVLDTNGFVIDPLSCVHRHAGGGQGVVACQWCRLHQQ
jgi:hypothetical protein